MTVLKQADGGTSTNLSHPRIDKKNGPAHLPAEDTLRSKPDNGFGLLHLMDSCGPNRNRAGHDAESKLSGAPFVPLLSLTMDEAFALMAPGQTVMDYYRAKACAIIDLYAKAGFPIEDSDAHNIVNGPKSGYPYKSLTERIWDAAYISAIVSQFERGFQESVCTPIPDPPIEKQPPISVAIPLSFDRLPENPDDCDLSYLDEG